MKKALFDLDWRFALETGCWREEFSGKPLPYQKTADDSGWRRVDLPYYWSIELPRRSPVFRGHSQVGLVAAKVAHEDMTYPIGIAGNQVAGR